ncbi:MAG: hypothetical protein LKI25_00135 [Atopobiaceae bacterium]|nr:hypothetical protein [Atopobiaceae bacterium]MCI2172619.1 hypothetical protein [Atopobiaceae bacterium]
MDDKKQRQDLLNGKKTERIIFAVTPKLKNAVASLSKEDCVSMSSLISCLLADEVVRRTR